MKKKLLLALLALSTIVACNDKQQTPLAAPVIQDFGISTTDTTIALGAKIDFAPKVSQDNQNINAWLVNGENMGTAATYSFSSNTAGLFTIKYAVSNSSGIASHELTVRVKKYIGGYYILNEGWFGHDMGSINHFEPKSGVFNERIYNATNPALTLGNTSCFAAKWQGSIYVVSKQGLRLVAIDELSFANRGSLSNLSSADGRAFAGINSSWGVTTTTKGAYLTSLNPLAIGDQLDKTANVQCGAVYATQENIFVIVQNKGIYIYSIADNYSFVKSYAKGSVGFAKAKDGSLWAADGNTLLKIDTKTLSIEEIAMPTGVVINSSWGAWNAGSLCASPTENWLYFTKSGTWGGGREIYRYKIGDISSLNQVFATSTATDDNFYGSGIGINEATGDILATFVKEGWSDYDDNRLVVFDATTGAEKSRLAHKGFFFPAMIISNK